MIVSYLKMLTEVYGDKPSVAAFVLKHGREYQIAPETYQGKRMRRHMCYQNATHQVWNGGGTYVEGYVSVHGVALEHAWLVRDGILIDPTLRKKKKSEEEFRSYFGVPFLADYLTKRLLETKFYGLLCWNTVDRKLLTGEVNPNDFLAEG